MTKHIEEITREDITKIHELNLKSLKLGKNCFLAYSVATFLGYKLNDKVGHFEYVDSMLIGSGIGAMLSTGFFKLMVRREVKQYQNINRER
ncbi:hypothetical protein J4466_05160 [Candidatus Pacearchaeota archaeon]|nr:hypothetical protein [Candidatus Pacearchaeota archaeon]